MMYFCSLTRKLAYLDKKQQDFSIGFWNIRTLVNDTKRFMIFTSFVQQDNPHILTPLMIFLAQMQFAKLNRPPLIDIIVAKLKAANV